MKNLVWTSCYYYTSSHCLLGHTKLQYKLQSQQIISL